MHLKSLASLPRKKLESNGQNYDLAYVTPQLIVTSMPTADYWRSWYRTSADDLKLYLESNHTSAWHIWNLQEPAENNYTDELFENKVSRHPMPDHTPPSLARLLHIVGETDSFVNESEDNVAVVHCKAGMGRSGTVACSYLMLYHGLGLEKSLEVFTGARMRKWFGAGVTIPSQLRYLRYIENIKENKLSERDLQVSSYVKITSITIRNPKYADIIVDVKSAIKKDQSKFATYKWDTITKTSGDTTSTQFTPVGPSLYSPTDVVITVTRAKTVKGVRITHSSGVAHFNGIIESFESFERAKGYVFTCLWSEFDGLSGTWFKGTPLFASLEVNFEVSDSTPETVVSKSLPERDDERSVNHGDAHNAFSPEISAFEADAFSP